MTQSTYLKQPDTGIVDTEENWIANAHDYNQRIKTALGQTDDGSVDHLARIGFKKLVEVRLADGSDVPKGMESPYLNDLDWVVNVPTSKP